MSAKSGCKICDDDTPHPAHAKKGRVCDKHGQWSDDDECPYCEQRAEPDEEQAPELTTAQELGAGSYLGYGNNLP